MRSVLALVVIALVLTACSDKKTSEKAMSDSDMVGSMPSGDAGSGTMNNAPVSPVEKTDEEKPEGPLPVFEFKEDSYDFGTINEGDEVEHTFAFTNTGDAPLIIQSARGSCGCTVPTWPKEPIPVGGAGEITAKFNSKGKPNMQNKTVTITANTWPKKTTLRIKAMVTPKAGDEGPIQ